MATLDYAMPPARYRARVPWGPFVFRPSRRTLMCLFLALDAWVWTAYRPQAWRLTGVVTANVSRVQFTPSGKLLAVDETLKLFDPRTAQRVATRGGASPRDSQARWAVLSGGREVLRLWPPVNGAVELLSTEDFSVLAQVHVPYDYALDRSDEGAVTGRQFLTSANQPGRGWRYDLWSVTGDARHGWRLERVGTFDRDEDARLSPDGKHVLSWWDEPMQRRTALITHLDSPETVTRLPDLDSKSKNFLRTSADFLRTAIFLPGGREVALRGDPSNPCVALFDLTTGLKVCSASPPLNAQSLCVSDDGELMASYVGTAYAVGGGARGYTRYASPGSLEVTAVRTGETWRIGDAGNATPMKFFPDHRRLIGPGPEGVPDTLCTYDARAGVRLATLTLPAPNNPARDFAISDDGKFLAVLQFAQLAFYEQVTPDQRFGPAGWPGTWAAGLTFAAVTTSLWRDARRRPVIPMTRRRPGLALAVLAAAAATTLLLLLTFVNQNRLPAPALWPAPLLALCGIGLALDSRFWWATAGLALLLEAILLALAIRAMPAAGSSLPLADTTLEIPPAGATICLALLCVACVIAAGWLLGLALRARGFRVDVAGPVPPPPPGGVGHATRADSAPASRA